MKYFLLFLYFVFSIGSVNGQAVFTKLAEKRYSDLPVNLRIENSGIYCISSFDLVKDDIWLNAFDSPVSYCITGNRLQKTINQNRSAEGFIPGSDKLQCALPDNQITSDPNNRYTLKRSFLFNKQDVFEDDCGILSNAAGEKITVNVKNRNELVLNYEIQNFNKTFKLNFPSTLAYSDLIGIDSKGNSFVLVETYVCEIPLRVKREVYTLSPEGSVLSILEVPSIKYLYMVRDFQVDAEGNLYHLLTEEDKLTLIKWSNLTIPASGKISYPQEYNYELNYNNIVPNTEAVVSAGLNESLGKQNSGVQAVSRSTALRIAESYVLYKYQCKQNNLAPSDVTGPDGDVVRTPSWLIVGMNAKVPYMWGGFCTLSAFSNGLLSGRYSGDINTAGVSGYAVGVDCSGFVSRCWSLNYHCTTSGMPDITTQYSSWDEMKPGDAVLKNGHVRMFIDKASNGALRIAEASARDWAVSYWTYTPSDLTAYTPRSYNGMINDYSVKQPLLLSALKQSDGTAKITFSCDTAGVKGFRLYSSADGTNWRQIQNENTLNSFSTTVTMSGNTEYYRVSSVLNNSTLTESGLSNALGTGKSSTAAKKILIVDGFDRDAGGWRGNGTVFTIRYGNALSALNMPFESVKSSQLANLSGILNNYDAVYWMSGDESTLNETFSTAEQALVQSYLEGGGKLFVSGSEIGWDLSAKGTASDKSFYSTYLKASFLNDNASSKSAAGVAGSALGGTNFNFAQTYEVGYPDEIGISGGSTLCMQYANGKGAGIQYSGTLGASTNAAKLIYLGFPLETTANDTAFNSVITKSSRFFFPEFSAVSLNGNAPQSFSLLQNYPNPFNPSTIITYALPRLSHVDLKIYDMLGREVSTLVSKEQSAGEYKVQFDASSLPSGMYVYSIEAGEFRASKKLLLIK
ncbi:MAG: T9SS type A sorting domain-containing protein [Ignavibacteria bacterium]|jgi:cell wall-associated NlpC family hydrolase|nr:T9SS type A sorting domain-containing protein [Ignavibacteria bacterium]MCU7498656.1 T9SS type A sorting domain-containing protein [Ignavibacteria bacterium]MCU7512595.1 T9SS type A sorting domain-containing protein [Ignavibacteria bacterium]MCU7519206.1 T9SS type A sorting domain-containing protein [Ignavibacteria bacterium]MCU7524373.1 T9SS type A sorting domain-containing protein [Ignavibacteria bacterium]